MLGALCLMAAGLDSARSQTTAEPTPLDTITVSAERVPAPVYDSPATVSVTEAKDIDRRSINAARDLAREEPGISVGNQPTRGGATSFTIRGIGDNRVRVQVDGIKEPDFPETNKGAGTYTRDFVDFDSLKQVEIIRGPASALYGSDAIGGVVSFVTKDPSDYLRGVGKDWYLSGKHGYDSTDRAFIQTYTGAWRKGAWEGLLLYTRRQGHEVEPNTWRTPNPQDYTGHNILAKILYHAGEWGDFRLTGEYFRRDVSTNILTDRTTTVLNSRGDDSTQRPRVSFDWTLPVTWAVADKVRMSVYYTEVDRQELTRQQRSTAAGAPVTRLRYSDFDFRQQIAGAEIQATGERDFWGWHHTFTYGGTLDNTSTSRPRQRTELNLLTGVVASTISGETFPNKNFPDTQTTQGAIYLQDIAQWGAWRVVPALRFDGYHLDPQPDRAFANSNTRNFTVKEQTEFAVSPKFGVTYDVSDTLRLFGQYAHGFRAPPYDNANFGFSNPLFGYEILPNGNLKPETSDGVEAGLRGRFLDGSSFQVSAFYNRYQNFLESRVIGISPAGLQQFQYQNLSQVRIWGFEGKGEWRFTDEWSLFGSFAYAHGEDEQTRQPLDSVDPFTGLAGVRYHDARGWGAEVRARGAARKSRVSSANVYQPASWLTADALVSYDFNADASVNLAVYNILDRRYFNAQDVAGLAANNTNLELFRASGRTFAVNATVRW